MGNIFFPHVRSLHTHLDAAMSDELYRAVPAPVTVPAPGSLGEAINVFFDRAENCLPTYVGRTRALIVSVAISLLIVLLITPAVLEMKSNADSPQDHLQWIGVSLLTLIVAMMAQSRIADLMYNAAMFRLNHQHIANLHWIRKYKSAYSPGVM